MNGEEQAVNIQGPRWREATSKSLKTREAEHQVNPLSLGNGKVTLKVWVSKSILCSM